MCDGDSDCEDNSDEENCEALACRPPSHPCANNTSVCLPPDKLCDGKDDCGDGSDEGELCGKGPSPSPWTPPPALLPTQRRAWGAQQSGRGTQGRGGGASCPGQGCRAVGIDLGQEEAELCLQR